MLALFSLILALLLTAAIVIVLHRFQETSRANAADREQGLPPLDMETADQTESRETDNTMQADAAELTHNTEVAEPVKETATTEQPAPLPPTDWKQQSQQLKATGDYDAALQACQLAWPQWQSYQQSAVVIRAAIRSADSEQAEQWLKRLYQLAAEAGFLHDKVDDLPQPNWQTLARHFTRQGLSAMLFEWQELGYRHMRLLTKTDIRQMISAWGEPAAHQSAKYYYRKVFISQSAY